MTRLLALVVTLLAVGCSVPAADPTAPVVIDDTPAPTAEAAPAPAHEPAYTAPHIDVPAPLPAIRVWLDPSINPKYIDAVRAGVEGWRMATAGVRDWTYTDDYDHAELAIREIGPYGNTCAVGGTTEALGCVQGVGGLWHNESGQPMTVYLISTTFSADGHAQDGYQQNPTLVTMHEIGHLLGLTHGAGLLMGNTDGMPHDRIEADWTCPDAETIDTLETKLKITGLTSCEAPKGIEQ